MAEKYEITAVEKPAWGVIGGGIHAYNIQQAGPDQGQTFCYVLKAPDGEVVGGIIFATHWNWLYIDLMWITETLRGRGYGHRLLEKAEEKGREMGARHAYLDTFSFQAPKFYKDHGYEVFGALEDFPEGHTRYYLTKKL